MIPIPTLEIQTKCVEQLNDLSIEECEIKKEELFDKLELEKDEEEMDEIYENETNEGFKYLHTLDSKFPPYMDLTYFY